MRAIPVVTLCVARTPSFDIYSIYLTRVHRLPRPSLVETATSTTYRHTESNFVFRFYVVFVRAACGNKYVGTAQRQPCRMPTNKEFPTLDRAQKLLLRHRTSFHTF